MFQYLLTELKSNTHIFMGKWILSWFVAHFDVCRFAEILPSRKAKQSKLLWLTVADLSKANRIELILGLNDKPHMGPLQLIVDNQN